MSRKPSLKDLLFRENSGDFSGAGTFQGGPFGFGNRYQLADSEVWPGLIDPEEDLPPNMPSMWPALNAQKDSDKTKFDSLESAEVYDDKPHILPGEDTVRDELLSDDEELKTEPSYYTTTLNERDASDILYRDLPGFPPMNTLADPEQHVPDDEDEDREAPEEERYNVPQLLPGGREAERGKPFGHGHYDKPNDLNIAPGAEMYDPMQDEITDNNLKLLGKKNRSLNRWKETELQNKGHTNRDELFNHLVKPEDYIKKSWGQQETKDLLDDEDDVPMHGGSMGVISNPVKHVPGPVDIYKKGNPGYSLGEATIMADKKTPTKRELEDYVPKEVDKKVPEETQGNGMGQTEKAYDFPREDRKIKKDKPLDPPDGDPQHYIPYGKNRETIHTIIMSKLFDKLAKLADKKE